MEEERLYEILKRRGFVREDGLSKWGKPVLRTWAADEEPQARMDASALQRRFVACACGTPSPGDGLCASWVEQAFSRLGIGVVLGSAAELYNGYCHYTSTADLKVGMIVAVPSHPYTPRGPDLGHVALYTGDAMVMDAVGNDVRTVPLRLWLCAYGLMADPRWGWLGSIGLLQG